jgi:adenylyltransferase/sulfurtransferase
MNYRNVMTSEVRARLERGDSFRLIDIREPYEHAIAAIDGAVLLPMSQAQNWIGSLSRDEDVVLFCHHGSRSQQLARYLAERLGFSNIANMVGGIDEWSRLIDPQVPRY